MSERPLILVSNDDGVNAAGVVALRVGLEAVGDVVCVAPETEQSANSHALTLDRPLRHRQLSPSVHAVDGTPADCVYVALHHDAILDRRPAVVVSGINHGPNLGSDVYYSGTVAAAREGALRGIPAVALSLCRPGGLDDAASIAVALVQRLLAAELPGGPPPLLNVNFPGDNPRGVRATRLGRRTYQDSVMIRHDPRGREYFWIGGPGAESAVAAEGADTEAVAAGYASVTPLSIEATYAPHFGMAAWVAGDGQHAPASGEEGES